jgi:hypothetical protein
MPFINARKREYEHNYELTPSVHLTPQFPPKLDNGASCAIFGKPGACVVVVVVALDLIFVTLERQNEKG